MRLRSAVTAVLGAALLCAAMPASASAASGQFRYDYVTVEGYEATGFLNNPPSDKCLNLQGVGEENPQPGHSPKNRTDSWATVYAEPNCKGDSFRLRPFTGGASERLKVRSVLFD
ncbi:hypothetical protein ACH4LN_08380 [Streptomyces albus]|uniref:Uncharacterized protein n=1 Tax=Streptomyces albus TaxID=1888 RepID=A0A6C1BXE1_9ACTN|nr:MULTISPECIES: hypothetical protein [Streptomyces]KPC96065.1 hypothetical protein ADL27_05415 [Streptomyces sp. NRRL F-6602]MDI6410195.1 hypothetical protein [Streptomyces albus]QID34665.1 hypothetical protein G3260_000496 [Streptomyces albus]TGG87097.1 hypothetical protein D8771_04925 [Streptomyces albus]UVN58533.1 hypothetical protein NR995_31370 [Streptomyces albus]